MGGVKCEEEILEIFLKRTTQKFNHRDMNDILEGFEEILDDLKEFPDKGKINALTKMVRNLLEDELWSNSRLFLF